MADVIDDEKAVVDLDAARPRPALSDATNDELVRLLAERARAEGLRLAGEGGLLSQLTKRVLESALEGEITDHLGYDKHDPAGTMAATPKRQAREDRVDRGGPISIVVPRDREGSFEPQIVRKRQRRLTGVDDMVVALSAKGLTNGEICAHLGEVYGASVSRQTISTITDRVIEGMAEWQYRPLDPVYPVLFLDCIHVEIRDGNVANRPIYLALAVTVEGTQDILGLWAGETATVRARSFGCRRSPSYATGASATCAWSSATASKGCRRRSKPFDRKRLRKRASSTSSETVSATPRRRIGRRSPRTSSRSTPHPANRPPWTRSSPSASNGATGIPRSSGCGSPHGRNLFHSCSSTTTFARSCARQMPLNP